MMCSNIMHSVYMEGVSGVPRQVADCKKHHFNSFDLRRRITGDDNAVLWKQNSAKI